MRTIYSRHARRLVLPLLAAAINSPAAAAPPAELTADVPDGLEHCGQSDTSFFSSAVDETTADRSLTYTGIGKLTLNLQDVRQLQGKCAPMIYKSFGRIVLYNDIVLEGPESNFALVPELSGRGQFEPAQIEVDLVYEGYRLVDLTAYQFVNRTGGQQVSYLAVWEGESEWKLTQTTVMADGHVNDQVLLLSSNLPLRSTHFLPALHGPTGLIWLTQEVAPDLARVLLFNWTHAGLTPPP